MLGEAFYQGDSLYSDLAAHVPWREFRLFAEHGVLPEAGGVRDQPHALLTALEWMEQGYHREKTHHQRIEQHALMAALSRG